MDTFLQQNIKQIVPRQPCAALLPPGQCCALLNSPLVKGMAENLQNELLQIGTFGKWERGEHLFLEGDSVKTFYFLFSGKVREYYFNSSGVEFLRRVVSPSQYISLHNIFNHSRIYSHYAELLADSTTFSWPLDDFLKILHKIPEIGLQVANVLSLDIERSYRQNCLCRKSRGSQRVAGYLLSKRLTECIDPGTCQNDSDCCNVIDLRPLALAAQEVCLARETFSRILLTFQKNNIIRINKGVVTVLNIESLKCICGIE